MPRVACAFTINLPHRKNKKQKTERFRYTVIQMTTMSCQRHIGLFSKQHLLPSLDVAISPYCNSLHTTFPGQQWMHWLCVGAQRASNPNRDKISLFLSRLHNGSCGGGEKKKEKKRHFPHCDRAGTKNHQNSDCRTYRKLARHC